MLKRLRRIVSPTAGLPGAVAARRVFGGARGQANRQTNVQLWLSQRARSLEENFTDDYVIAHARVEETLPTARDLRPEMKKLEMHAAASRASKEPWGILSLSKASLGLA